MPSQRQPKTVTQPTKELQVFPNPNPERDYEIAFDCPEFTCLCPLTGQPDFASFEIRYVPDELCVETKSLKLYLWSYRNEGAFHEKVTNTIADDIVKAISPRQLVVEGNFFVRGGISTLVTVRHDKTQQAPSVRKPAARGKRRS
jgi:7-cyano-7-deazaguanine reductase